MSDPLVLTGFAWPTPAALFGGLVFSIIGFAAFRHGRRTGRPRTAWIGVALMPYPYVVSRTGLLYAIGVALRMTLWFDRH